VEPKFNIEFLEEAIGFLDSLDDKSREKTIITFTRQEL